MAMPRFVPLALVGVGLLAVAYVQPSTPAVAQDAQAESFSKTIRPLLKTHCLNCHSTKAMKGELDLERFATLDDIRKDSKPWQAMIEQIETGEMPPKDKPQPTAEEKKQLVTWVRQFIDSEAKARKGDPGRVPLRRFSNAEYDATIRDLTGVDLRPTREFPADGAAGEGFTNAAEALTDISPALFTKYLAAAKEIADRAVLLPDGFCFSPAKTRRDWSDEGVAKIRAFYSKHVGPEGRLPFQGYVAATVNHRAALAEGKFAEIAAKEKLNEKYLRALYSALTDATPSEPLDTIRRKWKTATVNDVPSIVAEITSWQAALWQTARVGNYFRPLGATYTENLSRQFPTEPTGAESQPIRITVKPEPGNSSVSIVLESKEMLPAGAGAKVIFRNPRFEGNGPPLRLADYASYGAKYEIDFPTVYADADRYLAADFELAKNPKHETKGLNSDLLKRWIDFVDLDLTGEKPIDGKPVPYAEFKLFDTKAERIDGRVFINGWHGRGAGLPVLMANSSDQDERIPGLAKAKSVVVHPLPQEYVGVAWTSPITGTVKIATTVAHAHPACGNGVAWWLELRRGQKATEIAAGGVALGKAAKHELKRAVQVGDQLIFAVDAKDANHVCDLTGIALTIAETEKPGRVWDLAKDVVPSIHAGNPQADGHGNKDVWSFGKGPSRAVAGGALPIPVDSILGKWKAAAIDAKKRDELPKLAGELKALLTGPRPANAKSPDRALFDNLVSVESSLLKGLDATPFRKPMATPFGLPKEQFDADGHLVGNANTPLPLRLPAALFVGRTFAAEAVLSAPADGRAAILSARWDGRSPLLAGPGGIAKLKNGFDSFREVFPLFLAFPPVIPTDEVVSLKMFHREDEPLARLFLNEAQTKELDHLWTEHRFVSKQYRLENEHLPQFIGFVTQDQPKAMELYFLGQKPAFQKRADGLLASEVAAEPKQLDALVAFAAKAYRRPLKPAEAEELRKLVRTVRAAGANHDEAFRGALMRIFVSPSFLFRIEAAPPGKEPKPVSDWELASRLSYFLWSSMPDDELLRLAAEGKLNDSKTLEAQTRRMLADGRTRSLAVEFGTQWIHVRGFDEHNEKNEKLFPTFTPELRAAMNEEGIRFFQDLFQADRKVTDLLDSDATFLNVTLAKHYGIPGVAGPQWRRVEGVRQYGRGGILGFASVQAKQSGASRTSPVLRGNWVVETLLGEKLPKPPPNVPKLPEEEGTEKLTMRQQTERHVSDASCATCHVRIDPFGFALEKYDPIGRLRAKDFGGLPLDSKAKLRDGTEFDGIDGLRNYLISKKQDVIVRLFCKRLLGYALGRSVTLSDTAVLDEMVAELKKHDGRVSAAVRVIVSSPQFRMVRGAEFGE
jgi:Protein of unknown function (DUF1592)/Protein of unknown function (DUF1588)/Protein of unknown function (DUF1587)/Protein of unknown function (DUF1585)/Protein of unknown function (DUF1595)/Planctomycete cytochrome C